MQKLLILGASHTLEAEHTALSAALRVFLSLKWLIQEMIEKTRSEPLEDINLLPTVFEDNQSTCSLASNNKEQG